MADAVESNTTTPKAWQPFTLAGVAGFAQASLGRLLLVQGVVAVVAGVAVAWCMGVTWAPAFREAISRLPDRGAIRDGKLDWAGTVPERLAEGRFLSILILPGVEANPGQVADLQLEFAREQLKVRSLFGFVAIPYPKGWSLALNRSELEPWWGAWRPVVYTAVAGGTALVLMLIWCVLATAYAIPALTMAFLADRQAGIWSCWKLCGAALMPGAVVFTMALLGYGLQRLSLPTLLLLVPFHLAVGWIYVLIAPSRIPRSSTSPAPATEANPFGEASNS